MENSQEKSRSSRFLLVLSSLKMALATLISRVLGLVREQLIAAYFGASGMTDAFFVAYRIPNLLRDLFAEGAFSSAFVPVFTGVKVSDNPERTKKVFRSVFWSLLIVTAVLSFVIFLGSEQLVARFAPSFLKDPEKFRTTVFMVKVVSPFLCLISVSALLMGVLNTHHVFFIPAVTPALLNLAVIGAIIFYTQYFIDKGLPGIYAVAYGILFGGLLQFLAQIPFVIKRGYSFKPTKSLNTPEVKKILNKMGPGLIGFSLNQVNLFINTILATSSGVGAMSWLNFGFRLFQFPNGILSVSLGNSHLVHFSNLWKSEKFDEAKKLFQQSLVYSLFIMLPICVITLLYDQWLVNIVFERGLFNRMDTINSAMALSLYAIAMPFMGIQKICIPLFYTVDKQKIPVITSAISIGVNIAIAVFFIDQYGFKILALSMSISIVTNATLQMTFLKSFLNLKWGFFLNARNFKILLAAILPIPIMIYWAGSLSFFDLGLFHKASTLSAHCAAYFLWYIAFLYVFGEGRFVKEKLKKIAKK